ncbi:MAG: hypothetical protein N4A44_04455 [Alphaproteobacteria bacterium]|jgi:hypothetical protein|nr:hypothetical protein [Alphaproteobacteria bacterium]
MGIIRLFLGRDSLDWKKNINDLRLKDLSPSEKKLISKNIASTWLKIENDVFLKLTRKLENTSISLIKTEDSLKNIESLVRTKYKLKSTYYILNKNKPSDKQGKTKIINELDILLRRQTIYIINSEGQFKEITDLHRNFNKYAKVVKKIFYNLRNINF